MRPTFLLGEPVCVLHMEIFLTCKVMEHNKHTHMLHAWSHDHSITVKKTPSGAFQWHEPGAAVIYSA